MINFGIVGLGNIAHRVAKGIVCSNQANLYAVASRNKEKAEIFKETYAAKVAYGSYDNLLCDPQIDVVYICTPNQFHYEQIKMCLEFGKHVMCEKPMVETQKQVKELFELARNKKCFLMEAQKTMFTPLNEKIKCLIDQGMIGKLCTIRAEFSNDVLKDVESDHWVLEKNMGGASYDIGGYPISVSHFFAGAKIKEFYVEKISHPDYECDFGIKADVFYENGVYSCLESNWFYTPENKGKAILIGTDGYIEIPAFWKSNKAYLYKNGLKEEISVEMESDFEGEVSHVANCVENGILESPILGEEMSLAIIKILENSIAMK